MRQLLKNPVTLYLYWYLQTAKLLRKNKDKKLSIGYMSKITNSTYGKYVTVYNNCNVNNVEFSDFIYIANNTKIYNAKIGKFCSIGSNVQIGLGKHPTNMVSTFPAFYSPKAQCQISFTSKNQFIEEETIHIGNDVWIGNNVIILDGVNIGDGAIIAAGAVVTKNVDPYGIYGGIPAKLIRFRFTKEQIRQLLDIMWWNDDIEHIKQNANLFAIGIDKFLYRYK